MSDEHTRPAWSYCTHPGSWYQGYWYCLDEQCVYRHAPVPADPSWMYDHTGHDGYSLAVGPGADGENSLGDGTFRHGGATANDEYRDNRQPGSQLDQDAYQYYVQRYDGCQQGDYQHGDYQYGDYQQDDHRYNNQDGGQYSSYQDNVGQGDYDYPPNGKQPVPPSDVATMGSGSSTAQTHSPSSTETQDNDGAGMAGNTDEDTEDREERTRSYVQDGNRGGQGVDDALIWFPTCPVVDTPYPSELSIENESESGVDQSNIEKRPDLGPR